MGHLLLLGKRQVHPLKTKSFIFLLFHRCVSGIKIQNHELCTLDDCLIRCEVVAKFVTLLFCVGHIFLAAKALNTGS